MPLRRARSQKEEGKGELEDSEDSSKRRRAGRQETTGRLGEEEALELNTKKRPVGHLQQCLGRRNSNPASPIPEEREEVTMCLS